MNKTMKKTLSLLIAALMVVTMLPVTVFATDTDEALWGADKNSLTESGSFAEAINAAESSNGVGYIRLNDDIEASSAYEISSGKFTIDLNGKKITSTDDETIYISGGEVTIVDTGENGEIRNTNDGSFPRVIYVYNATLNIYGGNFVKENGSLPDVVSISYGATVNIYGGTFSGPSYIFGNDETLNIYDGNFSSATDLIYNFSGTANIYGGIIDTKRIAFASGGLVNICGGRFVTTDSFYSTIYKSGGDAIFSGGEFEKYISIYDYDEEKHLKDLIADGCYAFDKNGNVINFSDTQDEYIGYVKIGECINHKVGDDIDRENMTFTCTVCGKAIESEKADYGKFEEVTQGFWDAAFYSSYYMANVFASEDEKQKAIDYYEAELAKLNEKYPDMMKYSIYEQDKLDAALEDYVAIFEAIDEKILNGDYGIVLDTLHYYWSVYVAQQRLEKLGVTEAEVEEKLGEELFTALNEQMGDDFLRMTEILRDVSTGDAELTAELAEEYNGIVTDIADVYTNLLDCYEDKHDYTYEIISEATCLANAVEAAECTFCGATDEREVKYTKFEHDWSNNDGICAYLCGTVCEHYESSIPDEICDICKKAIEYPTLNYGDTKRITLDSGNHIWFKFIPEKSIKYVFYSEKVSDKSDPRIYIYYPNGNHAYNDDGLSDYQFKLELELEAGKTYWVKIGSISDENIFDIKVDAIKEVLHQPTYEEPSFELSVDADSYQWYSGKEIEITDKVARPANDDDVVDEGYHLLDEVIYDKENGWSPAYYVINPVSVQYFFVVDLKAGETLNLQLSDVASPELYDKETGESHQFNGSDNYSFTAEKDSSLLLISYGSYFTVKAWKDKCEAVEGETEAEFKGEIDKTKYYYCKAIYEDGTEFTSDEFAFKYEITHQPTFEETYVTVNDGEGAAYQWYKAETKTTELTDENAEPQEGLNDNESATYSAEEGWNGVVADADEDEYEYYLFSVELKKGDKVSFVPGDNFKLIGYRDYNRNDCAEIYMESGKDEYSFIALNDAKYYIYSVNNDNTGANLRAYVTREEINAIEGATGSEYTITEIGSYFCEVTFKNGKTEETDRVDVTHIHVGGTQACLGYKCETCGEWYGEASEEAHDYGTSVWNAAVIRPVYNEETGEWSQAYYVYSCINGCGATKTEKVNRADYTNYENILKEWEALISRDDICATPRQNYTTSVTNIKAYIRNDYVEREQEELDGRASAITLIIADLSAGLADGSMKRADFSAFKAMLDEVVELMGGDINNVIPSRVGDYYGPNAFYSGSSTNPDICQNDYDRVMREYGFDESLPAFIADLRDGTALKADYTAIDEAIERIEEKLQEITFKESVVAEFEEIRAAVADAKANVLTSAKDAAAFEKALADIEANLDICIDGTHNYDSVVTKATLTSDGKIEGECSLCGKAESKTIARVDSVTLSTTHYIYNGKNKTPKVTVKDAEGNVLTKNVDYKLTIASSRSGIGRYTIRVKLMGNYEGTKDVYFYIRPAAPETISATQSTTWIKLTWSKVDGAAGYVVYRYNRETGAYDKIKVTGATSFTDKGLGAGTKYSYKVVPYGRSKLDNIYYSKSYIAINTATKTRTPSITVASSAKTKATVKWNNVGGENGYQVWYSTSEDGTYKKFSNAKANTTSLTVTGLTSGKTYYFKVRTYKTTDSGYVYSAWSTVKSVKVK